VKRFAVSTRWAVHGNAKLSEPWLVVHDPEDGDHVPTPDEGNNLARSIALGHFSSLARGFGLASTAAALQAAKTSEPGRLTMPHDETLWIETDDREVEMIGAVTTSVGVLPIPRTIDVTEFLNAVRAVHGERSLFLGVDVKKLHRIDRGALGSDGSPTPGIPVATGIDMEDLFSITTRSADGAETMPLLHIRNGRSRR
jgi:hypothetical protein